MNKLGLIWTKSTNNYAAMVGANSTVSFALQVKEGETVKQTAYFNGTLRSLANGTNDEVSITGGVETKRVSNTVSISGAGYASLDTTNSNVDVVLTTAFADAAAGTTAVNGITRLFSSAGVELQEVAEADINLVASVGKYYYGSNKVIRRIVAKGAYADIAAARIGLGTKTLNYQFATPIITGITSLRAGDTLIWIPTGNLENTTIPEFTVYYFCR